MKNEYVYTKFEICLGKVGKHCEKKTKCKIAAISLSPTMFLKGNSLGVIKLRNLCGIGLEPSKKCDLFDREKMNPATCSILKPIPTQ